jgi:hypothetical protein
MLYKVHSLSFYLRIKPLRDSGSQFRIFFLFTKERQTVVRWAWYSVEFSYRGDDLRKLFVNPQERNLPLFSATCVLALGEVFLYLVACACFMARVVNIGSGIHTDSITASDTQYRVSIGGRFAKIKAKALRRKKFAGVAFLKTCV